MKRVILWDIDGTIFPDPVNHTQRAAIGRAVGDVWGIEDPLSTPVEWSGQTDFTIARAIAEYHGKVASPRSMVAYSEELVYHFQHTAPDVLLEVREGVGDLLAEMNARGFEHRLVSGNLREIGQMKLVHAGLQKGRESFFRLSESRFPVSEKCTKSSLVAEAIVGADAAVFIGDTPTDWRAAREAGIQPIEALLLDEFMLGEMASYIEGLLELAA